MDAEIQRHALAPYPGWMWFCDGIRGRKEMKILCPSAAVLRCSFRINTIWYSPTGRTETACRCRDSPLSFSLYPSLFLCLYVICLSVSLCLSLFLSFSLSLSVCLSVCLSLSLCLSVCLSVCLSLSAFVSLSACLSVSL